MRDISSGRYSQPYSVGGRSDVSALLRAKKPRRCRHLADTVESIDRTTDISYSLRLAGRCVHSL